MIKNLNVEFSPPDPKTIPLTTLESLQQMSASGHTNSKQLMEHTKPTQAKNVVSNSFLLYWSLILVNF